ncbi:PD-(D/E)XK nuclease family protein [Nocardia carnea]|uniref:DNA 3'-5' helicase n=1 Tax=Nocardia carnea TaxID=37328 RepID=A0ABW7TRM1_9NOCA|nr:PD-(D/E)XK nuclease family protein [Nocardia carnea]
MLGGPGTGKSALLVDVAAARIAGGADPESVLLLTHSKQAAAAARDALTERLAHWDTCAPVFDNGTDGYGVADLALFPLAEPAPDDGLFPDGSSPTAAGTDQTPTSTAAGDSATVAGPGGPSTPAGAGHSPTAAGTDHPLATGASAAEADHLAGKAGDLSLPGTASGLPISGATREPLARTIHSYAFGILRRQAARHGNPPPRLLTGAEQDAVLREMLRGDLTDIAAGARDLWPRRLQPALSLDGFADELRDLMLRATERGLGPEDLMELGRQQDRPDWVAAGRFALRYEQAMLLRWSVGVAAPEASAPALNAAELVGAALDALAGDADLLAAERARLRCLLVDDAQHLDPQAALLVRILAEGAGTTVIAGDPDQAVFTFRGADARSLTDLEVPAARRIVLHTNHRSGPAIHTATARIASRLPGSAAHRTTFADLGPAERGEPEAGDTAPAAQVRVRVLGSPAKEASLIADQLRRAHLTDGVPWSEMAVIVRSVPLLLPPLRRALLAAGVPVRQPAIDTPLARRRGAAWMLLSLRAVLAGEAARRGTGSTESLFGPDDALDLLSGPLGGADQIAMRRLRRGIRRTTLELTRSAPTKGDAAVGPGESGDAAVGPGESGDAAVGPGESGDAAGEPRESGDAAGEPRESGDAAAEPHEPGGALHEPGTDLSEPEYALPDPEYAPTEPEYEPPIPDPESTQAQRPDDFPRPEFFRDADRLADDTVRYAEDADWFGLDGDRSYDDPWDGLPPERPDEDDEFAPSPDAPDEGTAPTAAGHQLAAGREHDEIGPQPASAETDDGFSSPQEHSGGDGFGSTSAGPGGSDNTAGSPSTADDMPRAPVDKTGVPARPGGSGSNHVGAPGDDLAGHLGPDHRRPTGFHPAAQRAVGHRDSIRSAGSVAGRHETVQAHRSPGAVPDPAGQFVNEETGALPAQETRPADGAGSEVGLQDAERVSAGNSTGVAGRRAAPGDGDGGRTAVGDTGTADGPGPIADRPSVDILRDLLLGSGDERILAGLTEVELAPLNRALRALDRARRIRRDGGSLEDVLWALWTGSRLEKRWLAQSERGGAAGMQADRDLDAAVALFDAAAAYTDRLPGATIEGFVEYLTQQQIAQDRAARSRQDEAVDLLSAHAAAGREWEVVAVAGVQEGIWPDPRPRGTLLHTEDLVDQVAGITERVSRSAPILAEERRLLFLACSRARRSLLVTAVESVTGERDLVPSRFLAELVGGESDGEPGALPIAEPGRVLALHALVAELRAIVCDPDAGAERRHRAAAQLARLALAGIPGTAPGDWYGVPGLSSTETLWDDDGPVALSPSTVELLRTCPLRWALERHGGSDGENPHAVKGTLVHTLVQALAGRVPLDRVRAELARSWASIDPEASWHSRQELRRTEAMLDAFVAWVRSTRAELTQAGVEVPVDCELPGRGEETPAVRIRGRIDRLERDDRGRFVIVDVKTGKNPVSEADAAQHAQLATYQVAAAAGALDDTTADPEPGGARLVYVGLPASSGVAKERVQPAFDAEALETWRDTIHTAAATTAGPGFLAIRNDGCRHCAVKNSCPVQDAGRQVTDE